MHLLQCGESVDGESYEEYDQYISVQTTSTLPPCLELQRFTEVETMRCASCQQDLREGMDVIGVQEGIMGSRGLVPLEEMLILCSVDCLRSYFSDPKGYVQRVP